jgi:hypothetical protein
MVTDISRRPPVGGIVMESGLHCRGQRCPKQRAILEECPRSLARRNTVDVGVRFVSCAVGGRKCVIGEHQKIAKSEQTGTVTIRMDNKAALPLTPNYMRLCCDPLRHGTLASNYFATAQKPRAHSLWSRPRLSRFSPSRPSWSSHPVAAWPPSPA